MKLPTDYKSIFKDRVLYITGTGRSGTTILGKILSSMRPVVYLFEPALPRVFDLEWVRNGMPDYRHLLESIRASLFEDFILPQIQGRLSMNPFDWTYWRNSHTQQEITKMHQDMRRRSDAMKWIKESKPLLVIKNPEAQPSVGGLRLLFPGIRFIHMIRNGLDVVQSCMERGWFQDDYQPIDFVTESGAPWYVQDGISRKMWDQWNPETRAACVWRCTTEAMPIICNEDIETHYYEAFCEYPDTAVNLIEELYSIKRTKLTDSHIQDVISYQQEDKPEVPIDSIMEPERTKFLKLMNKLGYKKGD
jgi:hypothetical protein